MSLGVWVVGLGCFWVFVGVGVVMGVVGGYIDSSPHRAGFAGLLWGSGTSVLPFGLGMCRALPL